MTVGVRPHIAEFLHNEGKSLPGRLLYAKLWGSWSHNTQVETSDVDWLAVYQEPTIKMLSLTPPADTIDGKDPDYQAHELGKFVQLLYKGNPGVVECLFTERDQWMTPVFTDLRDIRHMFLNNRTLAQYLGYCRGQLDRLRKETRLHTKGGTYNTKWAYHMVRLSQDAVRIARGQPPVVFRTEGVELDLLRRVRAGEYGPEDIENIFLRNTELIMNEHPEDKLLATAPKEVLDEWLFKARMDYLR